jgi:hypothetical protein
MIEPEKEKARDIWELSRKLIVTLEILASDVRYAEEKLRGDNYHEQFWRRVIIRAVCALGEGTLNAMKGMIPRTAAFFNVRLTEKETAIITETRMSSDGNSKAFFLPIHENLKETLKLYGKIHSVELQINFDQGYEDFCATFILRNRLMHPKSQIELEVNDPSYRASVRGWNWFNSTLNNALRECGKKLPFSEKP